MISGWRGIDYDRLPQDVFLERVSVALHMYADESGTHDETGKLPGSEVAVVAGYIAEQDQWGTFCQRWRETLNEYGIKTFHASDLLGPHGLCLDNHNWPQERIDAFVHDYDCA